MRRGSSRKTIRLEEIALRTAAARGVGKLPPDLADRIKQTLAERSALSWDQATSEILDEILE